MNFYKQTKWVKKRANVLRRDGYLCQECKRYGKQTSATTVHHINPLEHHPELKLDSANLLSLCGNCHNMMHDRTTHELTDKGKEWVERMKRLTPPPQNIFFE